MRNIIGGISLGLTAVTVAGSLSGNLNSQQESKLLRAASASAAMAIATGVKHKTMEDPTFAPEIGRFIANNAVSIGAGIATGLIAGKTISTNKGKPSFGKSLGRTYERTCNLPYGEPFYCIDAIDYDGIRRNFW